MSDKDYAAALDALRKKFTEEARSFTDKAMVDLILRGHCTLVVYGEPLHIEAVGGENIVEWNGE